MPAVSARLATHTALYSSSDLTMIAIPAFRALTNIISSTLSTVLTWNDAFCCERSNKACSIPWHKSTYTFDNAFRNSLSGIGMCPSECTSPRSSTSRRRFLLINEFSFKLLDTAQQDSKCWELKSKLSERQRERCLKM